MMTTYNIKLTDNNTGEEIVEANLEAKEDISQEDIALIFAKLAMQIDPSSIDTAYLYKRAEVIPAPVFQEEPEEVIHDPEADMPWRFIDDLRGPLGIEDNDEAVSLIKEEMHRQGYPVHDLQITGEMEFDPEHSCFYVYGKKKWYIEAVRTTVITLVKERR